MEIQKPTKLPPGADTGIIVPNAGPPPHTHAREDEVFCILKGTVSIYDDGERREAEPGTWIHLPRGTRHWLRNETVDPGEMLFHVAPAGIEDFFRSVGIPRENDERPPFPYEEDFQQLKAFAPSFGMEIA